MNRVSFVLIVVFLATTVPAGDICGGSKCVCTSIHGLFTVSCIEMDLESFPNSSDIPIGTLKLDLSRNDIKRLGLIDEIDGLKTLSLAYNKLETIEPNTFEKYNYLENLDLSNNKLSKLEVEAFAGLEGIHTLNLSGNYFRRLPDKLFHGMPSIKELHLYRNPLHLLRYELLQESESLVTLDVSNTGLDHLAPGVFHSLINLEALDLSGNSFERIPSRAIQSAPNLKHLKLNRNRFAVIKEGTFKKLTYLESLEISDSSILTTIESGAFSGLKNLKILRINSNDNLRTLDFGAFDGLYSSTNDTWTLRELYLRQNGLRSVDAPSSAICYIGLVDLQENPWTCDCNMKWIAQCTLRTELTSDLTCNFPIKHNGVLLRTLNADDFVCDASSLIQHQEKILRIVVIASGIVGIFLSGLIIIIVIKRHQIMEWWYYRKRGSGAVYYVKAESNAHEPADA